MECENQKCSRWQDCAFLDIFKKQPTKERQCSYFKPFPKDSGEKTNEINSKLD